MVSSQRSPALIGSGFDPITDSRNALEARTRPFAVDVVGERLPRPQLPRQQRDARYDLGVLSDYFEARPDDHHILRCQGSTTSYLVYSVSGLGFLRDAQDGLIRLGSGDLALVEARTQQEYAIWPHGERWGCHWVHFDAQPHWSLWLPLAQRSRLDRVSVAHIEPASVQRQVNDLFFALHSEAKRREAWSAAMALNLLERILILVRRNGGNHESMVTDSRVSRVLQAIETSAPRIPSAAVLSQIAGLSPSRLAYVFKQHTGISILQAVNRVRLRAAREVLRDSAVTLHQAAERCGFSSPYSFSNWYLKQTGVRPGQYQRRWAAMVEPSRMKKGAAG